MTALVPLQIIGTVPAEARSKCPRSASSIAAGPPEGFGIFPTVVAGYRLIGQARGSSQCHLLVAFGRGELRYRSHSQWRRRLSGEVVIMTNAIADKIRSLAALWTGLKHGTQVVIITEGDRSATTILPTEDCSPSPGRIRARGRACSSAPCGLRRKLPIFALIVPEGAHT